MKTKNLTLTIASVFALFLCLAFASATLTANPSSLSKTIEAGKTSSVSFSFNLTSEAPGATNYTINNWESSPTKGSWGSIATKTVYENTNESFSAKLSNIPADYTGEISADLLVNYTAAGGDVDNITIPVTITVEDPAYSACPTGSNSSDLDFSVDIENTVGEDDETWAPLDIIEIEVEFENDLGEDSEGEDIDLEDVVFELQLLDSDGDDVAEDMLWTSEDENEFEFGDVDEGDDAKHIFKFRVAPEEIKDGDYTLLLRAYPEGEDETYCIGHSSDLKEYGSVYYANIDVEKESDKEKMVIIDTENLPSMTASCEQEVTFTADVWNIGDTDFEDQILVTLYNKELGINKNKTVIGDLDAGEMTQVSFTFDVPSEMDEETYTLRLTTAYEYDEDDNEYDELSDESFTLPLKVEGNCILPKASVSASLEEGGKAGDTLVIRTTLQNTGVENSTYTVGVTGYSEWASDVKMNNTYTLESGESEDLLISLEVKKEAAGEQSFDIETYSDGRLVSSQPVQVTVEPRSGLGLSGGDSAVAILIALITAVAIAIVIVLIVKASKKE